MKAAHVHAQTLIFALLSLLIAGSCQADTIQDAMAARASGDYANAFNMFNQLASAGDASAEFQLAMLYETGRGTKQDPRQAMHWLRMSAAHGNTQAQSNLGVAYSMGLGVTQDALRAYVWFAMSADAGNAAATINRDVLTRKLTAQQFIEAKALLTECQSKGFQACL